MDLKQVKQKQKSILLDIINGNLGRAFKYLPEIAFSSKKGELISELEALENNYKNILKYSFGYAKDPNREDIYLNLKRKLVELLDDIVGEIYENSDEWFASIKKNDSEFFRLGEKEKFALIDEMAIEKEFSSLLNEVEGSIKNDSISEGKYNNSLSKVFDVLWLTNNYTEGEKILAKKLFETSHIPWYDKSLIVSAIFLSTLRHFDEGKIEILFQIYDHDEKQISQRALVSIFILSLAHKDRINIYPSVINRFKSVVGPEGFARQWEQITLQFIRAQETEKVTQKIQQEIIPEVMKLRPEIEEKLKLDELINKENLEEKNPDWEQFFGDTPEVYKKLEEFSMMQMDGSDVFMGAFSLLKRFGFFDKISNWFLPFYKNHPEIIKSTHDVEGSFNWDNFFEGIQDAPVMCNSDKYSFCFNLGFMPDAQKSMMLELFNMELKQMKEVAEEDGKHDHTAIDKTIFTQYIQDLYRFFKLHEKKEHFSDVFNIELDILNLDIFNLVFSDKNIRKIGEFYFQKNYFEKTVRLFTYLNDKKPSYELVEKIGFCYQKLGNYEKAIEFYLQAEIFESNKSWLQKKLGLCYTRIGEYDKAIEYYIKVEKDEPDNLDVQAFLGQLHIDKEDYEGALKYYFKVEYLKPGLIKVQRPIGWCSFLLRKSEQALRYFQKVAEVEGQRSDFLNLGHCYWAIGNISEAIENYRKAIKKSGSNFKWFSDSMQKDEIYLSQYGIEKLDVLLMADYLTIDL